MGEALPSANAKSGSGQGSGQNPGLASDAVAQQADGNIRFEIPLNHPYHVQGGPAQDAHDGGRVPLAHTAVVLPELHVQGAVQFFFARRYSPVGDRGRMPAHGAPFRFAPESGYTGRAGVQELPICRGWDCPKRKQVVAQSVCLCYAENPTIRGNGEHQRP